MSEPLPLFYPSKSLADMETMLRKSYLESTGWLESAEAKMALRDGQPVPWLTYPAIAILERITSPDLSLFEYGGGQSTLYWAERLARVVAVDHDPALVTNLQPRLPANAHLSLVGEWAVPDPGLVARAAESPDMADPPRTDRILRSGQLNATFCSYALQLLAWPEAHFDIVVVYGTARVLSSWAAIRHFPKEGFVVFDNADREEYRAAYEMFEAAGIRRIDFWGLGPINSCEWCTAIFCRSAGAGVRWFTPRSSAASVPTISDQEPGKLGILVLGYNRPYHLQAVLESLRLQGRIDDVHVWIDGTQGRGEYVNANRHSVEIASRYLVREVRVQRLHLGIEKMTLDALDVVSQAYDRVLVLEDDCFPPEGVVDAFEATLAKTQENRGVYSIYGRRFGVERPDEPDFPRFQGWGWAAHSNRIQTLLPDLRRLFLLNDEEYLDHVRREITDRIRARQDVTTSRNVLGVLEQSFLAIRRQRFSTPREEWCIAALRSRRFRASRSCPRSTISAKTSPYIASRLLGWSRSMRRGIRGIARPRPVCPRDQAMRRNCIASHRGHVGEVIQRTALHRRRIANRIYLRTQRRDHDQICRLNSASVKVIWRQHEEHRHWRKKK